MIVPNFFEDPVLNSPYSRPARHWQLEDGRPTNVISKSRRSSELFTALPGASATSRTSHTPSLFGRDGLSTEMVEINPSPIINELRGELESWRALPNPVQWKVSPATQTLLRHWRALQADTSRAIRPFFCQIEAVETAIWLAEVAPQMAKRGKTYLDRLNIANNFAVLAADQPPSTATPDLLRIAFKLATGAGKTTVMAMLIAWQAVNAARSGSKRYSNGFLVVTPGITIRDRLRVLQPNDPENVYTRMNLVPHDMMPDLARAKIVITNYHVFGLRETFQAAKVTRDALEGHGDRLSTTETEGQMLQRAVGDLVSQRNVIVINDEAHHCYRERPISAEEHLSREEADERREARLWLSGLEALNRAQGVSTVYDLSATPFFLKGSNWPEGTLFPWVLSDFSLMDAIECGIVKLPRVPVADNRADGQKVIYRDLWKAIGKRMPKKAKGDAKPDPLKLPIELKTALDALYGHYEKTFAVNRRAILTPYRHPILTPQC